MAIDANERKAMAAEMRLTAQSKKQEHRQAVQQREDRVSREQEANRGEARRHGAYRAHCEAETRATEEVPSN